MEKYVLILITVPSMDVGKQIAHQLIINRLAACANILPGITSIYTWQGRVNEDQELLLLVKTREVLIDSVIGAVKDVHPYDLPEIIALPITGGDKAYLEWIAGSTIGL